MTSQLYSLLGGNVLYQLTVCFREFDELEICDTTDINGLPVPC